MPIFIDMDYVFDLIQNVQYKVVEMKKAAKES